MEDFKNFQPGDTFRLQFNHRINGQSYPESVYCIFKSCSYIGNTNYVEELVVDQIIEVKSYLEKGQFQVHERKFKHFDSYSIHFHLYD